MSMPGLSNVACLGIHIRQNISYPFRVTQRKKRWKTRVRAVQLSLLTLPASLLVTLQCGHQGCQWPLCCYKPMAIFRLIRSLFLTLLCVWHSFIRTILCIFFFYLRIIFKKFFYWKTVDLQCFVDFCYTTRWFSFIYICIHIYTHLFL